jgi:hopene-associated glycosyltransferase HpnB
MMMILASISVLVWVGLLAGRGFFWWPETWWPARAATRMAEPLAWPAVTVVVPARDEAPVIGDTVRSLLMQDYPGALSVVVVDDGSADGTADLARQAAEAIGQAHRLTVAGAGPLPIGWTGKMWAQSQAIQIAETAHPQTELWLLTDADIRHQGGELRRMVTKLVGDHLDMASLMVRLSTGNWAEKAIIPAFIFFFRLLYPFRCVNAAHRSMAAAAGGYILIRRRALDGIGGLAALRNALIDDCTLAALVKGSGRRIWLGLSGETVSLRQTSARGLWAMITRSAYTQLHYSPMRLAGTVVAMLVVYVLPPVLAVAGGAARWPALLAWGAMSLAYLPMLRYYRLSPMWAPLLPLVSLAFLGATLDSAWGYYRGRGGVWKGRVQAPQQREVS